MKIRIILLLTVLIAIALTATVITPAQTRGTDTEIVKKLNASQKRELNGVFPLKTRQYLLKSKSLFVTQASSRRTVELTDSDSKKRLLDSLFFDTALAKNVRDTCRTPEYLIQTESGSRAEVMFSISFGCNDVTGGGVDFHLIQGRIDGKKNRTKAILQALFEISP